MGIEIILLSVAFVILLGYTLYNKLTYLRMFETSGLIRIPDGPTLAKITMNLGGKVYLEYKWGPRKGELQVIDYVQAITNYYHNHKNEIVPTDPSSGLNIDSKIIQFPGGDNAKPPKG